MRSDRCAATSGSGTQMVWLVGEGGCSPVHDVELAGSSQRCGSGEGWLKAPLGLFHWTHRPVSQPWLLQPLWERDTPDELKPTSSHWVGFIPDMLCPRWPCQESWLSSSQVCHLESKVKGWGEIWALCGQPLCLYNTKNAI